MLVASLVYMALPHFIFYLGWLRRPYAVLAAACLCGALILVWRAGATGRQPDEDADLTNSQGETNLQGELHALRVTRQDALALGGLCLLWLTLAGIGGLAYQDLDWHKHNMVLNSLMRKPWPTVYEMYKVDVPLVYYIAYYLPAALVGRLAGNSAGWLWMNFALFVWSGIGLALASLWFWLLVRRVSYVALLIFVFFSGLDVIGKGLASLGVWDITLRDWQHIDAWAGVWQYSSHATQLNWVPPQAIGGWVVTGMLIYCLVSGRYPSLILLPFGLSALWSPFITLGLLPYLVIAFLTAPTPLALRIRQMISLPNAVGLLALAVTGFYYAAKFTAGSPLIIQDLLGGLSLEAYRGSVVDAIAFLLFFCLIEFGLYVIVLYRSGAVREERWRWLFDMTVVALCILPWFTLGVYNDLVMRASIPALFVLAVVVTRAVLDSSLPRPSRMALIVLLLVGAITPAIEFKRHVTRMATQPAPLFDPATQAWDFIYYMQRQTFFLGQYAGSMEAPFFRTVARPQPAHMPLPESSEAQLNAHDFVLFDRAIYLLRDRVEVAPTVVAGKTVTLTLEAHFFGPKYLAEYAPALRLVDGEGNTVWSSHGWPAHGRPHGQPDISPFWMTLWAGEFPIPVPSNAAPGDYTLAVAFTDGIGDGYLPAASVPEGDPLAEFVPVATIEVAE